MNKHVSYLLNDFALKWLGTPVYHPRFWADEREKRPYTKNLSFLQRWGNLLRGFNSDKQIVYQLDVNRSGQYLNDIRRRILAERISKKYYYIVHNKVVFHKYFQGVCKLTPRIGLLVEGKVFDFLGGEAGCHTEHYIESLRSGVCYFLKPLDGGSGRGIKKIEFDDAAFHVNGEVTRADELRDMLGTLNGYIVEEKLTQVGFSRDVYPKTLNTLRIMTMIDPETKEPFIPIALHRFGTKRSIYADNWSQGGLSVWIDSESGVCAKGAQYPFEGRVNFVSEHPDTGVQFEGHRIENWEQVRQVVLKAAKYVSFLPMLGWDIVLTGKDVLVLEANYNPDINLVQVHRPLLTDDRVRRFYEFHGVLGKRKWS